MDLTVAASTIRRASSPTAFRRREHAQAWLDTSALPRTRTDEHQKLVDEWVAATGKVPD